MNHWHFIILWDYPIKNKLDEHKFLSNNKQQLYAIWIGEPWSCILFPYWILSLVILSSLVIVITLSLNFWLEIKILEMTNKSFCIVNDTFPEDTPRGSLRGKNFGNAQICRASLLSFPCCNMHYVIKISEILWNG